MKTDIKSLRNKYSAKAKSDGLDPFRKLIFQFQAEYRNANEMIVSQAIADRVDLNIQPLGMDIGWGQAALHDVSEERSVTIFGRAISVLRTLISKNQSLPSALSRSRLPQLVKTECDKLSKIVSQVLTLIREYQPKGQRRGRVDVKGVVDRIFRQLPTWNTFDGKVYEMHYPAGSISGLHIISNAVIEAGLGHRLADYIKNLTSRTIFPGAGGLKEYASYWGKKKVELAGLLGSIPKIQLEDFAAIIGKLDVF